MLSSFSKNRPLLAFFTFTFGLAILGFIPQALYQFGLLRLNVFSWSAIQTLFSPLAAALIVQWLAERNLRVCRIYDSWKALAFGLFVGPLLILASTVIVPAALAAKSPLSALNWRALISVASYHCQYSGGFVGILLAPIVEEPGWRGFALPRLEAIMSPALASILLGVLWAAWHFPSFLVLTTGEILLFSSVVVALSILMALGFNLSKSSIVVALVMHAAINMRGCLISALSSGMQARAHSSVIWATSAFLVPAAAILLTRGRLGKPPHEEHGKTVLTEGSS